MAVIHIFILFLSHPDGSKTVRQKTTISGLLILRRREINSEIEDASTKPGHPRAKEAGEKAA